MDQPPAKESRAPINLRIKFRSESIDQFIERYSIDVSRGGIFIRTREPLAVGTQLKFDFQLQDSSPLMAGEGTVVWIREYDANRTGITPGMGVRFDKLTAASQPVLERILAEKGKRDHSGPQSGGIMSKVGAGMAVRRPSSTFTALDPRALGLVTGPGSETPAVGTHLPEAARRDRHSSAPAGTPIAAASERTSQGGFAAPGGAGLPTSLAPLGSGPQRARTPGGLPALETTGSGRHGTSGEVPSLVSRLSAAHPSYEPPTSADIDKALDGLTGGEARPKETKSATTAPSASQGEGKALTSAVADSAAPVAEIDGERTQASSAEEVAAMIGAPERPNAALERTARDLVPPDEAALAAARAAASTGPSLVLIKNDKPITAAKPKDEDQEKSDKSDKIDKDDKTAKASSTVRKDELLPQQQTPQPTVIAGSGQSAAAGSFTASSPAAATAAGPPVPVATPGSGTAKTRTARPAKKKSAAPFAIAGLLGVAAVVAVLASQRSRSNNAQESFQQPRSESTAAPKPAQATGPTAPATENAAPAAAPEHAAKPGEAPAPPSPPPGATTAEAPAPSVPAARPAPAAEARAEKTATGKAPPEHKTIAVVGPPRHAAAPAADRGGEAKTAPPADTAGAHVAVQHLLKVTSTPAGAQVMIDGQAVGTTPYTAKEIDADAPHAVSIRLDGYEPHEHMISGADWTKQKANLEIAKVTVKLRKLPPAALDEPTAVKGEGAAAEPAKGEAATRPGEAKTEPAPAEKAAAESAAPPTPTEPPKPKDEPATAPPPVK